MKWLADVFWWLLGIFVGRALRQAVSVAAERQRAADLQVLATSPEKWRVNVRRPWARA